MGGVLQDINELRRKGTTLREIWDFILNSSPHREAWSNEALFGAIDIQIWELLLTGDKNCTTLQNWEKEWKKENVSQNLSSFTWWDVLVAYPEKTRAKVFSKLKALSKEEKDTKKILQGLKDPNTGACYFALKALKNLEQKGQDWVPLLLHIKNNTKATLIYKIAVSLLKKLKPVEVQDEEKFGVFEGYSDGACIADIAILQEAKEVAAALGTAVAFYENQVLLKKQPDKKKIKGLVYQPKDSSWSFVALNKSIFDSNIDFSDCTPLLRDALPILKGQVPNEGNLGYETPETTAYLISKKLACPAVGIWGSDQGDGLEGGAFFQSGKLECAYSALPPRYLQKLIELPNENFEDKDEEAEELEEALYDEIGAYCDNKKTYQLLPDKIAAEIPEYTQQILDLEFKQRKIPLNLDPLFVYEDALLRQNKSDTNFPNETLFAYEDAVLRQNKNDINLLKEMKSFYYILEE